MISYGARAKTNVTRTVTTFFSPIRMRCPESGMEVGKFAKHTFIHSGNPSI